MGPPGTAGDELTEEPAMLVLSRKFGQKFRIGDDVTITVVKLDRNSVLVGVEAARHGRRLSRGALGSR